MCHYAWLGLSFLIVCVYVCLWIPEEAIEHWSSLELELYAAMGLLVWVLRIEAGSSRRKASIPNC